MHACPGPSTKGCVVICIQDSKQHKSQTRPSAKRSLLCDLHVWLIDVESARNSAGLHSLGDAKSKPKTGNLINPEYFEGSTPAFSRGKIRAWFPISLRLWMVDHFGSQIGKPAFDSSFFSIMAAGFPRDNRVARPSHRPGANRSSKPVIAEPPSHVAWAQGDRSGEARSGRRSGNRGWGVGGAPVQPDFATDQNA